MTKSIYTVTSKPNFVDPDPVTDEQLMEAISWQAKNPWHVLSAESAEVTARIFRNIRRRKMANELKKDAS